MIFISASVSLLSLISGLFVFFKPNLVIRLQIKFYEKINWRMEPVSWQKEIRNTKIMGLFLAAVSITAEIYIFTGVFSKWIPHLLNIQSFLKK